MRFAAVRCAAVLTCLSFSVSATTARAQGNLWPAPVSNAGMVWDSTSGTTLLYGGMRNRGEHSDSTLWAWDGAQWSALGDGVPGARSGLILASDPLRHRVLLYGGQNRSAQFDDTWEWRGGGWSRVATSGPGARHMTAGVFDPAHNQLVLFGGYSVERQVMLGDTWVLEGSRWRKISDSGPPGRAGHVLGFDRGLGKIILMGGADPQGHHFSDTWSWDGSGWTRLGDGPAITPNSQLVARPSGGMASFGGWDGTTPSRSLFVWNGTRWNSSESADGPSGRMETSIAFDPTRNRLVLFGGSDADGRKLADLWEYDGHAWSQLSQSPSAPSAGSTAGFFALSVADLEASIRWYSEKLGLQITLRPPRYENTEVAVLEGNGLIVELVQRSGTTPRPGAAEAVQGFFKAGAVVDNFDALVARMRTTGVEIVIGPFPARPGQRANVIVRDNAGNLLQFFAK